jgi:hypothetical protein
MKVIKASQQDVFSEYLKIMSKFNQKRSMSKFASMISGIKAISNISDEVAGILGKTVNELAGMKFDEVLKLDGFGTLAQKEGSMFKAMSKVVGDAEASSFISKLTNDIVEPIGDNATYLKSATGDDFPNAILAMEKSLANGENASEAMVKLVDDIADAPNPAIKAEMQIQLSIKYPVHNIDISTNALKNIGLESTDELTTLKNAINNTQPLSDSEKAVVKKYLAADGIEDAALSAKIADDAGEGATDAQKATQDATQSAEQKATRDVAKEPSDQAAKETPVVQKTTEDASKSAQDAISNSNPAKVAGADAVDKALTVNGKPISEAAAEMQEAVNKNQELISNLVKKAENMSAEEIATQLKQAGEQLTKIQEDAAKYAQAAGRANADLATQMSNSTQSLETAIEAAKKSLQANQADALTKQVENFKTTLESQNGVVQAALKADIDAAVKTMQEGNAAAAKQLMDALDAKLEKVSSGVSADEVRKIVDDALDSKLEGLKAGAKTATDGASEGAKAKLGKALDLIKGTSAAATVGKMLLWGIGLGVIALIGKAVYDTFTAGSQAVPTQAPTVQSMKTSQNIQQSVLQPAMMSRLDQFIDNAIDCLSNKEKYKSGTQSEAMARGILAQLMQLKAAYGALQQNPNVLTLQTYSQAADMVIPSLSNFGLKIADRQTDLDTATSNQNDLSVCVQNQGQLVSKLQVVSANITSLGLANQALQMAQQTGQAGQTGQMQQGTTIAPGQQQGFAPPPPQLSSNTFPIFRRPVTLNINGVPVSFSLDQFNMVPRRNLRKASQDYQSLLSGGTLLQKMESSLFQKGRAVANPDRYKVQSYMFDSPSLPQGINTLVDLEAAAGAGDPNAMAALQYALARHVRNTLEAGGRDEYGLGGSAKRRRNLGQGFGFMGNRVKDIRRAKKEKNNKIKKESANNDSYRHLTKVSDDFSKSYYKDAAKDLNNNDPFLKEFYKSYGEFYEYKPEANDQKLYGLNEKDKNLLSEAHPQTAYVADARGKGGLVENSHEQHEAMSKMFGDRPTANFKGSYARLKQQMKKRGY